MNPHRFPFVECVEQILAVGLAAKLVGRRVSELSFVVANLGGGFGEGILVAQFLRRELAVKTSLVTRGYADPVGLCLIHSLESSVKSIIVITGEASSPGPQSAQSFTVS